MKKEIIRFSRAVLVCSMLFTQIVGCASAATAPLSQSGSSSEQNSKQSTNLTYPIVDTATTTFYSDKAIISAPNESEAYFGQDAQYQSNAPSYTNNGDGTISDNVTGLMWQQDMGEKMTFDEAKSVAESCTLGGYDDWRIPTIKELYSLIQFTGTSGGEKAGDKQFIDTNYFIQPIGDTSIGEREIDAQTWSSTEYVGRTMNNAQTIFGVNFIDGRIKGYSMYKASTGAANVMYFRFVRASTDYGKNNFVDNGDGTITDLATGLMWQKSDSGAGMDWEDALSYAEQSEIASYDDWRLPSAKELQSIVDYSRSPQTTNSAAIDPLFVVSTISDPDGNTNYPYFWSSTTHLDGVNPYSSAVYVAFGEAQGIMNNRLMDVHGAGAQRSDPKSGDESDYPCAQGPQGDIRYVYNYVRCVRTVDASDTVIKEENNPVSVTKGSSDIYVNGNKTEFDAYLIEDNNYFKLRDIAYILSSTGSCFDITWDSKNNSILLQSGNAYTIVGGEMSGWKGCSSALQTTSKIILDGMEIKLMAYNIGGYNYFKLRELATALNFSVKWDEDARCVLIETMAISL